MKITLFTSNQARHCSLIHTLAEIADQLFVVQECATLFPGTKEGFYRKSDVMQKYFMEVLKAEQVVFGRPRFLPKNASALSMCLGDLNGLSMDELALALNSDLYVVFGASYIKGDLIDFLVQRRAVNIHMGVSPYFRGSSCNFWAVHKGHPELVGATIHMLSKGLDSGGMLFHALPKAQAYKPFELGMYAVKAAHASLANAIRSGEIFDFAPVKQERSQEISYTKMSEFTDQVAQEFLDHQLSAEEIEQKLLARNEALLLRPKFH